MELFCFGDVVVGRERYRIYRRHDATALGYTLSPFEHARQAFVEGRSGAAAEQFRQLLAAGAKDPLVVSYAGLAIAEVDPGQGQAIVQGVVERDPKRAIPYLHLAEMVAHAGDWQRALALRRAAARLLPHELVVGVGAQPIG